MLVEVDDDTGPREAVAAHLRKAFIILKKNF